MSQTSLKSPSSLQACKDFQGRIIRIRLILLHENRLEAANRVAAYERDC